MATPAQVQLRSVNGFALTGYQAPVSLRSVSGFALADSTVRKPPAAATPEAALIAAINKEYNLTLNVQNFTFGQAQALVNNDFNSSVEVFAKSSSGYSGSKVFRYNRVDIPTALAVQPDPEKVKAISGAKDTLAYLSLINSTYGLTLVATDLDNQPVVDDGETVQVVVKIKAGNLLYQGTQTLELRYLPHISKVFVTNVLTGF